MLSAVAVIFPGFWRPDLINGHLHENDIFHIGYINVPCYHLPYYHVSLGLPGIHILTYSYLQVFIFLQYQYGARLDYHDWVSYTEVQRGRSTLDTSWMASSLVVLNTIDRSWTLQSLAGKSATVIHGSLKQNT